MYQSNRVNFLPLQSINSATFTGAYQLLGTSLAPCRIIKIVNNSNVNVTVSFDGITDHDFVPAANFILYDFGANKGTSANALDLPVEGIYVKAAAGVGLVYLTTINAYTPTMNIPGV